jgi:myo-inositol-1-phosphate synthase
LLPGVNDTYENLLKAIKENHPEIAPSTIFALAAVQEGCVFINGSPQNTFVKGLKHSPHPGILIGNDFKTGQTKFKTSFIDFLVNSGIKPKSCVSYNHLGNNDGKNLNSYKQF